MNKALALFNSTGIYTYLCTAYPNYLSGITNYGVQYELALHVPFKSKKLEIIMSKIKPMLADGAVVEVENRTDLQIDVIRITWSKTEK